MSPNRNHVEARARREPVRQYVSETHDHKPDAPARKQPPTIRIHFEDHGQDFLWWDLADSGDGYSYRVVDCGPFQSWFWTKYLVARETVKVGSRPLCTQDQQTASNLKYAISRIERRQRRSAS